MPPISRKSGLIATSTIPSLAQSGIAGSSLPKLSERLDLQSAAVREFPRLNDSELIAVVAGSSLGSQLLEPVTELQRQSLNGRLLRPCPLAICIERRSTDHSLLPTQRSFEPLPLLESESAILLPRLLQALQCAPALQQLPLNGRLTFAGTAQRIVDERPVNCLFQLATSFDSSTGQLRVADLSVPCGERDAPITATLLHPYSTIRASAFIPAAEGDIASVFRWRGTSLVTEQLHELLQSLGLTSPITVQVSCTLAGDVSSHLPQTGPLPGVVRVVAVGLYDPRSPAVFQLIGRTPAGVIGEIHEISPSLEAPLVSLSAARFSLDGVQRQERRSFYISTPIYYPNAEPHIGHAYTTITADTLKGFHDLFGEETFLLTGTDEHGQKVEQAAAAKGVSPQQYVDEMTRRFEAAWKSFTITPNRFLRTTDRDHVEVVRASLQRLYDQGDIYLAEHSGWYCIAEEMFYTDKDLVDGLTPTGKPVVQVSESNYFFRMSAYQRRLIEHIQTHPDFILPAERRAETLGFLRQPLEDLCISRPKSRIQWGIELPFDQNFVTYVWVDALLNYASGIGYHPTSEQSPDFARLWGNSHHLIGKDILTTHTVYWSTMLMALDLPLPTHVFAHGWWLNAQGRKMSKSEGDVVNPSLMRDELGVDEFRYYMLRGVRLGNDLPFSKPTAIAALNADLANRFGNLVGRCTHLVSTYLESKAPRRSLTLPASVTLASECLECAYQVKAHIEAFRTQEAVVAVNELLTSANRYFGDAKPWESLKSPAADTHNAHEVLYVTLETLRIAASLLHPIMPNRTREVLTRIGWHSRPKFSDCVTWGLITPGSAVIKGAPLFRKFPD